MTGQQLLLECFKVCARCAIALVHSSFTRDARRPDGLNPYCRDCSRARNRASYLANKPREKQRKADAYRADPMKFQSRNRRWREANRDRQRATNRTYYHANRERVAEWHRRYYEANRQVALAYSQRRRARLRAVPSINFTPKELDEKWAYWGRKCWICRSEPEATDHVKPISKGGAHMLANLRPICKACNSSKHDRWPFVTSRMSLA